MDEENCECGPDQVGEMNIGIVSVEVDLTGYGFAIIIAITHILLGRMAPLTFRLT